MNHFEQLKQARRALHELNPAVAIRLLNDIADNRPELDRDDAARMATELVTIRDLAAAACEGIAATQAQLAELMQLTGNLGTYDRARKIQVADISISSGRKF